MTEELVPRSMRPSEDLSRRFQILYTIFTLYVEFKIAKPFHLKAVSVEPRRIALKKLI